MINQSALQWKQIAVTEKITSGNQVECNIPWVTTYRA